MMKDTPLVSVIMPAYNTAAFIGEAIESVIKQTYAHWELLIIDDASIDGTLEVISTYLALDSRIISIKNSQNKGTALSRNLGIEKSNGAFIAFLDSDDQWLPYKLKTQVEFMQKYNLEMTFSSYFLLRDKEEQPYAIVEAPEVLSFRKLLRSNYVGNLTGIYDVTKTGKILVPELRKRQDWALWLFILKKHGKTRSISRPLAIYRIRKESLSQNKWALLVHNYKIYKGFLGFGFLKSYVYMGFFLWEHFFVKSRRVKKLDEGSELF